jgi:hypothetical protein
MARTARGGFVTDLRGPAAGLTAALTAALAAGLALTVGLVAAQSPQEIQALAEQVIRRLDLQTEFPVELVPRPLFTLPAEVLWLVIIIAIGVLLYAFRDLIPGWRTRRDGGWAADEMDYGGGRAGSPAAALGAADQLAAEGRFVDAMHVLLLHGLATIRERLDEQFADSLTSREILRSTRLSEAGRTSLRDIVSRVELTYFGRQPAALADYVACRASFNALAQTLHGSQAA